MTHIDCALGTHDVQNVSVTSLLPGQIRVTGNIIEGSTATGVLVIVSNIIDVVSYQLIESKFRSLKLEGVIKRLADIKI